MIPRIGLALVCLTLTACSMFVTETGPTLLGVLRLVVLDEQERPLPGATVAVGNLDETNTDVNGIALVRVYAETPTIFVRKRGYQEILVPSTPAAASPYRVVLKPR